MADQKPTPITLNNPKVEISTDGGSTWTDISGFFTALGADGSERPVAEEYVATADTAVIGTGKRPPQKLTISAVYTEGASDAYTLLEAAWRNNTPTQLRLSPRNAVSGANMFVFGEDGMGFVTKAAPPAGDTHSGKPVVIEFGYVAPDYSVVKIV